MMQNSIDKRLNRQWYHSPFHSQQTQSVIGRPPSLYRCHSTKRCLSHNRGGVQTSTSVKYAWATALFAEMRRLGSYISIFYSTSATQHANKYDQSLANTSNILSVNNVRYDTLHLRAPKSWRIASLVCRTEPANKKSNEEKLKKNKNSCAWTFAHLHSRDVNYQSFVWVSSVHYNEWYRLTIHHTGCMCSRIADQPLLTWNAFI